MFKLNKFKTTLVIAIAASLTACSEESTQTITEAVDQVKANYQQLSAGEELDASDKAVLDLVTQLTDSGVKYMFGEGVIQDYKRSREYFEQAAAQNDLLAYYYLAMIYEGGLGVPVDLLKAMEYYETSAPYVVDSQRSLGVMYYHGHAVNPARKYNDLITAHMWLNIASSNGDPKATEFRDQITGEMEPWALEKATVLAQECLDTELKSCATWGEDTLKGSGSIWGNDRYASRDYYGEICRTIEVCNSRNDAYIEEQDKIQHALREEQDKIAEERYQQSRRD